MTTIPPGWYEDGPDLQRWWDGERWTDRTRPFQAAAVDTARGDRDPKSARRILWISVGAAVVVLAVVAALVVPALLGAADRSRDEQAAIAAVEQYSDGWTDGDCDAYLSSTTEAYRGNLGLTDCVAFETEAALAAGAIEDYAVSVTDVNRQEDEITVRTRESFTSLLDAGGAPVPTPIPVETSFVYVLVPTEDGWAIDFADVDE